MKKLLIISLVFLLSLLALPPKVTAQNVNNFSIDKFDGKYQLSKDSQGVGQLTITESITAIFPDYDQNHGIERAIPMKYKNNSLKLKVDSVTKDNGQPWHYTTREQNKNLVLRIGDADRYVHGKQTYLIKYSVSNVITFYDNHDELFWDINGDGWLQTFQAVDATINIDQSVAANLLPEKKCYTGSFGSTEGNCLIKESSDTDGTEIYSTTTQPLSPKQTLSIQLGFKKGTFQPAPTNWLRLILTGILLSMPIVLPLIAGIIMFRRWRKSGKDPKGRGIIIPQYTPPAGVNPLVGDVILNEQMRPLAVSATIMDLSIRQYFKIYETEKKGFLIKKPEYEIELAKNPDDLSEEEKQVISMLFSKSQVGERINISQQKNKLYTGVKNLSKESENSAVKKGFYLVAPSKSKQTYLIAAWILFVAGFIFISMFGKFSPDIFSSLPVDVILGLGLFITATVILLFAKIMPKKTAEGIAAKEHLLGLKDYMKLAEADRIKTLQSPSGAEKKPAIDVNNKAQLVKLYEKLLPYAILFGIEKDWAKQIAPLYEQPPEWYSGNQAFSGAVFISAVSDLNSATINSFSAPSSSGSGGGAGGGGGGGGGGGW